MNTTHAHKFLLKKTPLLSTSAQRKNPKGGKHRAFPPEREVIMGEDFSHLGEVLFEIITLGQTARVTAVQAATGREATIVCPSRLTRFSMELAALRKLNLQVKPPPSISYR